MSGLSLLALGGVGAVGKSALLDVLQYGDFERIVVGDIDAARARRIVREIGDERLSVVKVDAGKVSELRRVMKKFDLVMNSLPFKYDYNVTKAAVDVGISGDDVSSTESQFDLHEKAKEKDVIFVAGCGATPGITNVLVAKASEILDSIETVKISWAAFRCTAPAPGLLYTTFWEFLPELKERAYYKDGRFIPVPPFEGEEVVRFAEPIGEQKVYYVPHPETRTIPRYFKGVKRVEVKGTWPSETMNMLRFLLDYDIYSNVPVKIKGRRYRSLDLIFDTLLQLPKAKETKLWGYGLNVKVTGMKDGERKEITMITKHPPMQEWGGPQAYYKNVGIPLSIGIQLIARGEIKDKGVLAPEAAFKPDIFLEELAKRQITVEESIRSLEG